MALLRGWMATASGLLLWKISIIFSVADPHFLVDQFIWDRVEMLLKLDVIIDIHPGSLPEGMFKGRLWQRAQEQAGPVLRKVVCGTCRGVCIGRLFSSSSSCMIAPFSSARLKKVRFAQTGQNPAFHDLHAHFHLGLVRAVRLHPGRDDHHSIVLGQLKIGWVRVGSIPAGMFHPLRQVIRDDDLRHTPEEYMGAYMSADPVRHLLTGLCFGIGIAAGALGCHEDLRLAHFPPFPGR